MINALHVLNGSEAGRWVGANAVSDDMLEILAALTARASGFTHHLLVLGDHSLIARAKAAGVTGASFKFIRSLGWWDLTAWNRVRRAAAASRATHVHAWGLPAAVALAGLSHFKKPRLCTLVQEPSEHEAKMLRALNHEPWRFIASSHAIERTLGNMGVSRERVVLIRPGIATAHATGASPSAIRKALGINPDAGPVILIGGDMHRSARHDLAMWAAAIVQLLYPNMRIILRSGPASEKKGSAWEAELRRFAAGMADQLVTFAPHDMHWGQLAQAADMLVATPDAPISTGSILWAMAAGVPVVATPVDCCKELIDHGNTGLVASPGKPRLISARMTELLTDATLRQRLAEQARNDMCRPFTVARMVDSYVALYHHAAHDLQTVRQVNLPAEAESTGLRQPEVAGLG